MGKHNDYSWAISHTNLIIDDVEIPNWMLREIADYLERKILKQMNELIYYKNGLVKPDFSSTYGSNSTKNMKDYYKIINDATS